MPRGVGSLEINYKTMKQALLQHYLYFTSFKQYCTFRTFLRAGRKDSKLFGSVQQTDPSHGNIHWGCPIIIMNHDKTLEIHLKKLKLSLLTLSGKSSYEGRREGRRVSFMCQSTQLVKRRVESATLSANQPSSAFHLNLQPRSSCRGHRGTSRFESFDATEGCGSSAMYEGQSWEV